jgi:integration host factor subunit beta
MPIKSDIVHKLSKRFPQLMMDDVNLSINVILNEIGNALLQGRKAEFREFGVFTAKKKPARTARNPKTGSVFISPEKVVPHFKPSVFLNRRLNNQKQELKLNIKSITYADEQPGKNKREIFG